MKNKLKAPQTIYLQWDDDPLAENTWCETQINDDDIKYIRPGRSDGLEHQVIVCDAIIEKLIEAGTPMAGDFIDVLDVQKWYAIVAEYRAIKVKEVK